MALQQLFPSASLPRPTRPDALDLSGALELLREHQVRFLTLRSCDIFGSPKSLEVPAARFEQALRGEVVFDGSAMDGQSRIDEADMLLCPDLATLRLLPWGSPLDPVAAVTCDVQRPDGTAFEGDPRGSLRRVVGELASEGLEARVAVEMEFFLLHLDAEGFPSLRTADRGQYYDEGPDGGCEVVRRDLVNVLEALGIDVAATHHEVAEGQYKVQLAPVDPITAADQVVMLKLAARSVAARHGLHASFMPKPVAGVNGAGMHLHQMLLRSGSNAFFDPEERDGLSQLLRSYVAGLLRHARGYCAVTCPLVNSYKRLVPGFQAPVGVSWSLSSRAPLIRITSARGERVQCEHRLPDPSANPYLTLAVQLAAGLEGIRMELHPGDPVDKSIQNMTPRERARLKIPQLPRHLGEALDELEQDRVVRSALGEYVYAHFTTAKRAEWEEYIAHVHPWERERYLGG